MSEEGKEREKEREREGEGVDRMQLYRSRVKI
jgi:hypothetical protein